MKTAIKIAAIAVALPAGALGWAMGFMAFSFAWQTAGSTAYLIGTAALGIAFFGRFA